MVGEGFCPYASLPYRDGRVEIVTSPESTLRESVAALADLIARLRREPEIETALLIFPGGWIGYLAYLDLYDAAQTALETLDEEGDFTLAPFHPDFEFGELPPGDIAHWIHRAPYPTLHVLRTASIEQAVGFDADTSHVTRRNGAHAAKLGEAFFRKFLTDR